MEIAREVKVDAREGRSKAQKRRAVEAVLNQPDDERISNRQAALRAGVSHHLIQIVRGVRRLERS